MFEEEGQPLLEDYWVCRVGGTEPSVSGSLSSWISWWQSQSFVGHHALIFLLPHLWDLPSFVELQWPRPGHPSSLMWCIGRAVSCNLLMFGLVARNFQLVLWVWSLLQLPFSVSLWLFWGSGSCYCYCTGWFSYWPCLLPQKFCEKLRILEVPCIWNKFLKARFEEF